MRSAESQASAIQARSNDHLGAAFANKLNNDGPLLGREDSNLQSPDPESGDHGSVVASMGRGSAGFPKPKSQVAYHDPTLEQQQALRAEYIAERTAYFRGQERQWAHNRRARKLDNGGTFTVAEWLAVVDLWSGTCAYCGMTPEVLHADHATPLSRGGRNDIANILPSCSPCNRSKGTLTEAEYRSLRLRCLRAGPR